MKSIEIYEAEQAEWEAYVEAMRKPCSRCSNHYEGASWSGRCLNCHDLMARPYETGEDYTGLNYEL